MKTILFVCTGNICRSPMAAAIMRGKIAELGLGEQVSVLSAGTWAEPGYGASKHAAIVLGRRGIDLGSHRSQGITAELLKQADIVLVMEEGHRKSLFYLAPEYLGKVFLLSEMAGGHEEIGDPFGGPLEGYVLTADRLERLIERGMPKILKRLGVQP